VRESLKGQDLSFTEIAKVVGEKWQVLPAEEREGCERQANGAKEKYYAELAEYKKTPNYEAYQKYLEDFKAKHSVPTKGLFTTSNLPRRSVLTCAEGKRSKLESEPSTSARGRSYEQNDQATNRRLSTIQSDAQTTVQQKSDPAQPVGPSRLPAGPVYSSNSTSPANRSLSGFNSPRSGEQFSPTSASPRINGLQRDGAFDPSAPNPIRDPRIPFDANPYHQPSAYSLDLHQKITSTSPPSYPHSVHYQAPIDMLSRRTPREPARLPPLSHEDTTLSSESGHSTQGSTGYPLTVYPAQTLPVDPSKTMRMLPQPVPTMGPLASPLDRPMPQMPSSHLSHNPHDYRTQGSLAVLVRAGELASRAVDDDMMETEASP
jgi:hypothetical protein